MMVKRMMVYEMKRIFRDKMYLFFLFYPLLIIAVLLWLVPYVSSRFGAVASNVISLVFMLMTPFMFGAISAFTLLDDRDDHVFDSLKVTPLKVSHYLKIKLMMTYVFGLITTLIVLFINPYFILSPLEKILIALLSSLSAPTITLLVNAFSTNKVEGFVIMKASGLLMMLPIASLFVTNWTEFFLGIVPGFWPARMISMSLLPVIFLLPSYGYFLIGLVINSFVVWILFRIVRKRI